MSVHGGNVLFLIICSNHKTSEGEYTPYKPADNISRALSTHHALRLFEGRGAVRALITNNDRVRRDGTPLRSLPFNEHLFEGPDFILDGPDCGGRYLPAAQRYDGRLYEKIGEDRLTRLAQSHHHVLIISGLYGLLTPAEPIQRYSCHVPDDPDIGATWLRNGRLTEAIVDYIQRCQIGRVFEMMADGDYQRLIFWDRLHNLPNIDVLHASSQQYTGAALLPSLGLVLRRLLAESPDILRGITPGTSINVAGDSVIFQKYIVPHPTIAATRADMVGRMRRNIIAMLNALDTSHPDGELLGDRVSRLKGELPVSDIADQIFQFSEKRAIIEYSGNLRRPLVVNDDFWRLLVNDYDSIERWASALGLEIGNLEKIVSM